MDIAGNDETVSELAQLYAVYNGKIIPSHRVQNQTWSRHTKVPEFYVLKFLADDISAGISAQLTI